jgi:DNA-binding response OmpR family regulator
MKDRHDAIILSMASLLIIEDSPELRALLVSDLGAAGFEVESAADGLSGLEMALRRPPDALVLDWMLPGLDGLEVLRRLRASPQADLPVLMLTARSEEVDRVLGLELGADDYLVKPFSRRELLARLHALLRRAGRIKEILAGDRAPARQPLRWGGLALDPESFTAALGEQPLELTRTEFDLLALFLRNPGRTFSRSYLCETVWEQSYVEGDRSVDNAMLRLRKKLGPLGDSLETVWGVGYRLKRA